MQIMSEYCGEESCHTSHLQGILEILPVEETDGFEQSGECLGPDMRHDARGIDVH